MLWLAVIAVYVAGYAAHGLNPGFGPGAAKEGWWTWSDQQRYLLQAEAIANGQINAQTYFYPLGYSVLAVPFVTWAKAHAFFLPNVLLVSAAAMVWWRLARRWFGGVASVGIGVVFVSTHRWVVAETMIVPWNTLPTQLALLAGVWVVLTWTGSRALWALATLAALTYFVRPMDAMAFAPMLVWATLRLPSWKARLAHGAGGVLLVLSAWAAVGALNTSVFGAWRTPYETASMQHLGFFGYPLSYKLYWIFVEGLPLFGEVEPALLWRYPWMFLLAAAAFWWVRRDGMNALAALGTVGLSAGAYLNYNDFTPSGIYRFTLIHYLTWWFPLMFLVAAAAVWHGWRTRAVRVACGLAALAVIVFAGLRLEPKTVERPRGQSGWELPRERPLLVRFPSEPLEAVSELRLDGRRLIEPSDYVVPYVPSELRLLLGRKAQGEWLDFASSSRERPEAAQIGGYEWTWRISFDRVRKIVRRVFQHALN